MGSSAREKNADGFKWAFGLNRLSLRLIGVWPDVGDEQHHESKAAVFRVPVMVLAMLLFLLLPQCYALVLVIKELPLVIDNLMTSCAVLTSSLKIYFLWRSKAVLEPVVRSARWDWQRETRAADWEREAMAREAGRARLFTASGYLVLAGCYTGFALGPLFGIDVRIITNLTDYGERHLFVQSYLPYDYSQSPNYELTVASQLLAGLFVGMSVSIPDNYFAALVFHACAQFEILTAHLETTVLSVKADSPTRERTFRDRLQVFVDRHVHLMKNISAVEKSFSFIIVSQVVCMTVMICCLGFQILSIFGSGDKKPELIQVLTLVSTLFTLMMHTLVDCVACEILIARSTKIFYSIYKSDWYMMDHRNARDIMPIIAVSRVPQNLTAGKIFRLSLATYCNILKSALGYISMLIAVNGK